MPEINWTLLADLAKKPHPLLNIQDDLAAQIAAIPIAWTGEVFQQARSAHHLLDLIGIPGDPKAGYASDLDARTYLAIRQVIDLRNQLDRITSWHSRETGPAGMVGDYCIECGHRWPCDTRRMADGTHEDLAEEAGDPPSAAAAAPTPPPEGDGKGAGAERVSGGYEGVGVELLAEGLGSAQARFWVCPVEDHGQRRGARGVPVVTVEWDGDVAHCTAPGCGRSSDDERGCNCEEYDCDGSCCGIGNCTCTPEAEGGPDA